MLGDQRLLYQHTLRWSRTVLELKVPRSSRGNSREVSSRLARQ